MTKIQKVALAGATGDLGTPMLKALLDAGYDVTVFTRPSSNHTFPSNVKVVKMDYQDVSALTTALTGQDAFISTITTTAADQQKVMVDAAIAAGVKRLIPSEFGCDLENSKAAALPFFTAKVEMEKYVAEKCKATGTTYTFVYNNSFLDWGMTHGTVMDIKNKKIDIVDGGDRPFTSNPLAYVAKGVVAVLQHPGETANRAVRLNAVTTTQNKLLEMAYKYVGAEDWEITRTDSAELEKASYGKMGSDKPEDFWFWIMGFIKRATYGDGYGGDYSKKSDNAVLELKELTEQELEGIVKDAASS